MANKKTAVKKITRRKSSATQRKKLTQAKSRPVRPAIAARNVASKKPPVAKGRVVSRVWTRPEVIAMIAVASIFAITTAVFLWQRKAPTTNEIKTAPKVSQSVSVNPVLQAEFAKAAEMPLADRVVFWSAYLQKNSAAKDMLRELVGDRKIADHAPLIPDKFDCTTFVETVASLSHSKNGDDFFNRLLAIRYKNAEPTFVTRNHFPEIDWIPNNAKAGILQDVTAEVAHAAGVKVLTEKKKIDRVAWLNRQIEKGRVERSFASVARDQWRGEKAVQVKYLATKDLTAVLSKLENGTVVNFVHSDNEKKPVLISHQGYLIRDGGKVYLRHASIGGEVKMVPLTDYLNGLAKDPAFKKWPIIGVNLNRLT